MPKSQFTGTQKKGQKAIIKEGKKAAPTRAKALRKEESYLHGGRRYEATEKKLEASLKDLKKQLGPDTYKQLEQFLPGGKAYQNPDFYKEGKEGYKMAQRVLEPIQKQALANYGQNTLPSIVNQYGSESKSSSALTQALAASRANLERDLHAQTSGLAAQYGSDISRMNLAERARQQQMQYGTAADIFNAKRQAAYGLNEQERANYEYLNNLNLGSARNLQGAGMYGAQAAFNPVKLGGSPGGASGLAQGIGGVAQGAGSAYAAWQLAKWAGAGIAAPATGGTSLAAAAATP
jgi:hypothetical protein